MKKIKLFSFSILLLSFFSGYSQVKKWTIEECLTYAFEHNISILQSDLDLKMVDVEKKSAVGAYLPSLNFNTTHSWNTGLNQNISTGLFVNQTTQFTNFGLGSSVPIYSGLQNLNRLRKANLSILAAQYKLSKMKDDISLNITNAYLQILFNKEQLKVQKEQYANNEKQLSRTQELVNAGAVPKGDLLDMKATLATNKQSMVVAENALFLSKLSLAQLLQLPDFEQFDTAEIDFELSESEVMSQTPSAIFEKAKEQRSELKIAQANLEISEKDVKLARGTYQPTLMGNFNIGTSASYSDRLVATDGFGNPIFGPALPIDEQMNNNRSHAFSLQLRVPILNGLSARNNVERNKINLERNKIAYKQQELDLERNVFTAFTDTKGALNAYESAIATFDARSEAFNYAKEKYAVGMLSAFDLNQSQTLYVNSKSEVIRTKYDYIFKVKVLEFYFGIPITKN